MSSGYSPGNTGGTPAASSGAKALKVAIQNILAATSTDISWDGEDFDTDGYHDTAVNNGRLTIPAGATPGKLYLISYCIGSSTGFNSASERFLPTIYKGGNGVGTGVAVPGTRVETDVNSGAGFVSTSATTVVQANPGDYFSAGLYSSIACTIDLANAAFSICRV